MRGESYAGGGGSGPLVASPSTLFEVRGGENRGAAVSRAAATGREECEQARHEQEGMGGGAGEGGVTGTPSWLLLLQTVRKDLRRLGKFGVHDRRMKRINYVGPR